MNEVDGPDRQQLTSLSVCHTQRFGFAATPELLPASPAPSSPPVEGPPQPDELRLTGEQNNLSHV